MDVRLSALTAEWDEELIEFSRALDLLYVMSEAIQHEDLDLNKYASALYAVWLLLDEVKDRTVELFDLLQRAGAASNEA